MQKWEYLYVNASRVPIGEGDGWQIAINGVRSTAARFGVDYLNKWGCEGWELASTISCDEAGTFRIVFKRPAPDATN